MKIIISSIFFVSIGLLQLSAQSSYPKIDIKKGFPNHRFQYGEITLGIKELAPILKKNEQAYQVVKPAKVNFTLANVLTYVAVPSIIYSLALGNKLTDAAKNRAFWPSMGIGLSCLAVSIPLRIKANKQALKAVELYNSALGNKLYKPDLLDLKFAFTTNGIGVTVSY